MGRPKSWIEGDVKNGFCEINFSSWKYFHTYIIDEMLDYTNYIWRGQKDSSWHLEPTLDRLMRKIGKPNSKIIRERHLKNYIYASRGRRGINPPELEEDEWWALGQHYGLATPFLDWTTSPFVAAYFAFIDEENEEDTRAIFALNQYEVNKKSNEIKKKHNGTDRPPIIEFIKPYSDENTRLVNQGGLFTRSPYNVNIESWIDMTFNVENEYMHLIKFTIPEKERNKVLRTLNRMNINHLTLFPDLYGASKYANIDLLIDKY